MVKYLSDSEKEILSVIYRHSLAHPSQFVFGALLGRSNDSKVTIESAVPIHHGHPLNIFIEVSLYQVDFVAKSKDLQVIGCYFVSEDGNPTMSNAVINIAEAFKTQFNNAIVLSLDLESSGQKLKTKGWSSDSGKSWKGIFSNDLRRSQGISLQTFE
eukprot:TRINITY_DN2704_c0_g1_i1.p1 TRINITY_DN2704_c0_g1~~TRINITY_DN2704_c0_g1_i1.p1  ORF type:complete len:157 (+),score=42.68 TRINITY_DN2704_c0_g1_i1:98-568(+)